MNKTELHTKQEPSTAMHQLLPLCHQQSSCVLLSCTHIPRWEWVRLLWALKENYFLENVNLKSIWTSEKLTSLSYSFSNIETNDHDQNQFIHTFGSTNHTELKMCTSIYKLSSTQLWPTFIVNIRQLVFANVPLITQ